MSVKGLLGTLLGLDASGIPYALAVDENGYVRASLPGQAGGGTKRNPKGNLINPVGISPSGLLKNLQVDANGNLIITLVGGSTNEIIKSDGTDAEWDALADVIKAAILTTAGDIMIVNSGGTVTRLPKPTAGQILGESSQIPAWITKPTTAYIEGARVSNSADIWSTAGVPATLTFDSERYDTDNIHSTASNTSRLTCKTAGKYSISGGIVFAVDNIGTREALIKLNGSTIIAINRQQATTGDEEDHITVETKYALAVNDYVELIAFHKGDGIVYIKAYYDWTPVFMMQRIG